MAHGLDMLPLRVHDFDEILDIDGLDGGVLQHIPLSYDGMSRNLSNEDNRISW